MNFPLGARSRRQQLLICQVGIREVSSQKLSIQGGFRSQVISGGQYCNQVLTLGDTECRRTTGTKKARLPQQPELDGE